MTIKARTTFDFPIVGKVGFTRTLKPGRKVGGQLYPRVHREAVAVDDETTAVTTHQDWGGYTVTRTYVDKGKDINEREDLRGIKTRIGTVNVFWEPTLTPQSRK